MAPLVTWTLSALACLAAGASAAAVSDRDLKQRDATNNPRYTPLKGTDPDCVWWWNTDDGMTCDLLLMVVGISEEEFITWVSMQKVSHTGCSSTNTP